MTLAPPEFGATDDATLALAAARGDREAFATIYDRYADRLYDFCLGMLRDRDAAADCVQDVFVDAATQLGGLRDPRRLRPWLYSAARHRALARLRTWRREQPSDELPDVDSGADDMATIAARTELAALIAEACGGLSERDRTVFELTYRHGLDGGELATALGVSHTNANTLAGRLREGVERSLGALLVLRGVRADPSACPELAALMDGADGTFTPLVRKRVARHIDGCDRCEAQRRRRVNPVTLLGGVPVFLPAPARLRDHTLTAAWDGMPPAATTRPRHIRAALGAGLVLLGIAGVAQFAIPEPAERHRVEVVTELDDATSNLGTPGTGTGRMTARSAPPDVPGGTKPAPPPVPTSTPQRPTTVVTQAPTVVPTDASQPTFTRNPVARPNASFTPSRIPEASRTTTAPSSPESSTATSTSTSTSTATSTVTSTSTATSTSRPPSTSPTTTTGDPIE